jgi:hypothetical protein
MSLARLSDVRIELRYSMKPPDPHRSRARTKAAAGFGDRLDRDGQTRKRARTLEMLSRFPFRPVLRLLGVPRDALAGMKELRMSYDRIVSELERTAVVLGPLGWVVHGLAHGAAYSEAATLVEQGQSEKAEELLVRTYSSEDFAFIRFYHRVMSLYQENDRWNKIGLARLRLLDQAYELHKQEQYAGSIVLVLTQIDGIFMDKTGKPAVSFFESQNPNLIDDDTLAGHPLGLAQLSRLMSETQRTTVIADRLNRHGILHGRLLGYETLRNSTKIWAALLALIEAVGPGTRWHRPSAF